MHSIKDKNEVLLVFSTTLQTPHVEAIFDYIESYGSKYNQIYYLDFIKKAPYRHEYSFRKYINLKLFSSRFFRNGIIKSINTTRKINKIKSKISNLHYLSCSYEADSHISSNDLYQILLTYSTTELGTSGVDNRIDIKSISDTIIRATGALEEIIHNNKLTEMKLTCLLFNGRLPIDFAIYNVINRRLPSATIIFHEINNYLHKVFYTDKRIHYVELFKDEIVEFYKLNKSTVLDLYFKDYRRGVKTYSSLEKKYITFFVNSPDEFLFTYDKPINQSKIIFDLLSTDLGAFKFVIRVHPNICTKDLLARNYWLRLKALYPDNVISFDENVDSYDLCAQSLFTVSIGSSMAAESIIMGIPHLLVGEQNWHHHFSVYSKTNEDRVVSDVIAFKEQVLLGSVIITDDDKKIAASTIMFRTYFGKFIDPIYPGCYPNKSSKHIDDTLVNEY